MNEEAVADAQAVKAAPSPPKKKAKQVEFEMAELRKDPVDEVDPGPNPNLEGTNDNLDNSLKQSICEDQALVVMREPAAAAKKKDDSKTLTTLMSYDFNELTRYDKSNGSLNCLSCLSSLRFYCLYLVILLAFVAVVMYPINKIG